MVLNSPPIPQGNFGSIWRRFGCCEGGYDRHLKGDGQGCCSKPTKQKKSMNYKEFSSNNVKIKMSIVALLSLASG